MGWFTKESNTSNEDTMLLKALNRSQAVIEFTPSGNILTANDNFLRVMGYNLEEIQGQHHRLFVDAKEASSPEYKRFWQRLSAGEYISDEFRRVDKSGEDVWIQASYNPVMNQQGEVVKVVKFATDITESKLKRAELEGRAKAISRAQAVIEFELDGTIITANDNFLSTLGYRMEEIKGQHHRMFVTPAEAASPEYTVFWQRLSQGEYHSGQYKRIGKNGAEIWIQASYNPIFDMNGDPVKVVKYATDITEQRQQERQARESARLASALKVCQANVMMADNDLNIVFVNEQVKAMLRNREKQIQSALPNFKVDDLIGTCVDDFHAKPSHQRAMLAKLDEPYNTNLKLAGLTFNLIATPWVDEDGKRLGTIVEWQDMTEELAREEKQKQAARENLRVRRALDNVSTNTMIADNDHNIVYLNEAVVNMMRNAERDLRKDLPNFDSNNLVGQNIDVFHKNPAHQRSMLEKLSTTYSTEIVVGGRTFGLVANPILTEEGERAGTVVEWDDRTAEVSIEKEINDLVGAARRGELNARVSLDGKDDFFLRLSKGLNQLVEVVDEAVDETATMLDSLAHGDLTKRIDSDFQGAFEKLKRDANSTADKLTEMIEKITSSANLVATGAEEISQGNTDLSQRTEEQASSLEETASSMEEMTSTVKQNADNAKVASELAEKTCDKAKQGGDVVNRAVSGMAEINEASKKIADIIGVIDEIAFQTNLLALNAAVEAARAGEQGRGFAVVAGEVRNLAQRSAGAAKEIKELIRDSVGKVEDGTVLVNESGATLQDIVESVQKVTQMISDISEASIEQSSGIEQVNKAVAQMDEMTQQNAALVEQASAASESMAEQANSMRQLLSFFSINMQAALPDMSTSPSNAVKRLNGAKTQANKSPAPSGNNFVDDGDEWEEF
ncbi:methyl-accepting chemotaxis protein I [Pseudoalteromonas sp. SW0106-04]|uniref:methyl-accepting chemotaxis protein n=1 Tax=Pseudoalteromonas sp. SW0106-04 TaxID=1702169 RepID=UPI0006B63B29|nr:methyl-accepting chemotaxis protein [Pseudoalteromonas sp. SW0106-04]GAP74410.1 methyl-accepting chemotaxis protein I [Pseudoalteromonas sp. SW0106-04]